MRRFVIVLVAAAGVATSCGSTRERRSLVV